MAKNILLDTFDPCNGVTAGYIVSKGRKYITIEYLTCWQGDYDKVYKIAIEEFEAMPGETIRDKAIYVDDISGIKPIKSYKVF